MRSIATSLPRAQGSNSFEMLFVALKLAAVKIILCKLGLWEPTFLQGKPWILQNTMKLHRSPLMVQWTCTKCMVWRNTLTLSITTCLLSLTKSSCDAIYRAISLDYHVPQAAKLHAISYATAASLSLDLYAQVRIGRSFKLIIIIQKRTISLILLLYSAPIICTSRSFHFSFWGRVTNSSSTKKFQKTPLTYCLTVSSNSIRYEQHSNQSHWSWFAF